MHLDSLHEEGATSSLSLIRNDSLVCFVHHRCRTNHSVRHATFSKIPPSTVGIQFTFITLNILSQMYGRRTKGAHMFTVLASNGVADVILLLRCYVVWGKRWKIIIAPICAFIISHVAAIIVMATSATTLLPSVIAGTTAFNTLLLSSLIAFRLYRMSRHTKEYLGPRPKNMYNALITISLESGILYAAFLLFILAMTLDDYSVNSAIIDLCIRSWSVIAAMMPTIIVVRVALGISLDDEEGSIKSIRGTGDSDSLYSKDSE
uniref:Uncharacterized protein n=1 Tax=Moniliophthora roreri TaxID=221103 RepID=A0A0W0FDR5_MONRR